MSDNDYLELSKKLDEGLLLAEKKMLEEKALREGGQPTKGIYIKNGKKIIKK